MSFADPAGNIEIVQVISAFRLIDERGIEMPYWRSNGLGLARGFYVARHAATMGVRNFHVATEFDGPYETRAEAEAAWADYALPAVRQQGTGPAAVGPRAS